MSLNQLLAQQDGIVSARQAALNGVSRAALHRQVKSGSLVKAGHGVYRSAQHAPTHEARLRAAVLAAGTDAVAFGPSAAWWHGLLDKPPARCWITVPLGRRALRNTAHCVRRRTIPDGYVEEARFLAVTTVPLTVLEAALEIPNGSVFVDQALQTRVNLEKLKAAHQDNLGRRGSAAAGQLLTSAETGTRSVAERILHNLLNGAAITGWQAQYPINGFFADAAFEAARLVLEVDGWAFHRTAERFHEDLRRHNALQLAGWRILRFDWHRLTNDPKGVIAEVSAALR